MEGKSLTLFFFSKYLGYDVSLFTLTYVLFLPLFFIKVKGVTWVNDITHVFGFVTCALHGVPTTRSLVPSVTINGIPDVHVSISPWDWDCSNSADQEELVVVRTVNLALHEDGLPPSLCRPSLTSAK